MLKREMEPTSWATGAKNARFGGAASGALAVCSLRQQPFLILDPHRSVFDCPCGIPLCPNADPCQCGLSVRKFSDPQFVQKRQPLGSGTGCVGQQRPEDLAGRVWTNGTRQNGQSWGTGKTLWSWTGRSFLAEPGHVQQPAASGQRQRQSRSPFPCILSTLTRPPPRRPPCRSSHLHVPPTLVEKAFTLLTRCARPFPLDPQSITHNILR